MQDFWDGLLVALSEAFEASVVSLEAACAQQKEWCEVTGRKLAEQPALLELSEALKKPPETKV